MKAKPLGDRIIVKPIEVDNTTKAGIIIPDTYEHSEPKQGLIVSISDGELSKFNGQLIPLAVKEGNKVLYNHGIEIKIDGEKYSIIKESDILVIL